MRVGVIVAARAPVPWLAEALESVLSQDPVPDEVVVVDHASAPALSVPHDVRLVRLSDGAGGPAEARDAGLAALGDVDLVALADADDAWKEGKLGAQLESLRSFPAAAVVFGRARVVGADGRETGERLPELAPGLHAADGLRVALYQRNLIPAASALIRREALEAVRGFAPVAPLPAASDWDLWLRLVGAGCSFLCEPRAKVRYRRHAGGLTADVRRLAEAGLAIHERHAGLVDEGTARAAQAQDLETLARGLIRERRYREARGALRAAADVRPPGARERLLRAAAGVPGVRAALGRRNPYR